MCWRLSDLLSAFGLAEQGAPGMDHAGDSSDPSRSLDERMAVVEALCPPGPAREPTGPTPPPALSPHLPRRLFGRGTPSGTSGQRPWNTTCEQAALR
jgi:hypothetical protein